MRAWVLIATAACGGEISSTDAGTKPDAQICVDLDPSMFDTSCNVTTDCIGVASGTFCSGYNCICPGATINASSQAAYDAKLATVPHGASICSCPLIGSPKCIGSQCVFCPNPATKPSTFPPGCPTSECAAAGGTCKPVSQNQCMGGGASMGPYDCAAGEGCCN